MTLKIWDTMGPHKIQLPYSIIPAATDIQQWYQGGESLCYPNIFKNSFLFYNYTPLPPLLWFCATNLTIITRVGTS